MKVINARPPNFAAIVKIFPLAVNAGTIFAYDGDIYAPGRRSELPSCIIAHELVHLERQKEIGADLWWQRYLEDEKFRYDEELLAHRAEYQALARMAPSRQMRRQALAHVAKKLSGALYGRMVTVNQAKDEIKRLAA